MNRVNLQNSNGLRFWTIGGIGLFILFLFRPFTIVEGGERGVVMLFGKVQDQVLDEGIHPVFPVVTQVKEVSIRVQKTEVEATAVSRDLQNLTTNIVVNWHVDPNRANRVFQTVGDLNSVIINIINPAVNEVVKASVPKRPVQAILEERSKLKQEIDTALKQRLAAYNVIVDDVSLVNFGFSPEFKAAIEAKQVAEQEAQKAKFLTQRAEQEAQAEINRAKGQAEAQRLLQATLTPEILQQRAIEKWDGQFPTVMTNSNSLPLINLDPASLNSRR